jgi:cyclase
VARAVAIPFTVGGGIATADDAARALDAGADKVSLNSAIVRDPDLIGRVAARAGSQAVVAAIDARREAGGWGVWIRGGSEPAGLDALAWGAEAVERGAGELLVTSIDRDGTRDGYDLDLLRALSERVSVPLIASGGAGAPGHLVDAVLRGRADAVLVAGILHYGETTIGELKRAMLMSGVEVRR